MIAKRLFLLLGCLCSLIHSELDQRLRCWVFPPQDASAVTTGARTPDCRRSPRQPGGCSRRRRRGWVADRRGPGRHGGISRRCVPGRTACAACGRHASGRTSRRPRFLRLWRRRRSRYRLRSRSQRRRRHSLRSPTRRPRRKSSARRRCPCLRQSSSRSISLSRRSISRRKQPPRPRSPPHRPRHPTSRSRKSGPGTGPGIAMTPMSLHSYRRSRVTSFQIPGAGTGTGIAGARRQATQITVPKTRRSIKLHQRSIIL